MTLWMLLCCTPWVQWVRAGEENSRCRQLGLSSCVFEGRSNASEINLARPPSIEFVHILIFSFNFRLCSAELSYSHVFAQFSALSRSRIPTWDAAKKKKRMLFVLLSTMAPFHREMLHVI